MIMLKKSISWLGPTLLLVAAFAATVPSASAAYLRPGTTVRASLATDGSQSEYRPEVLSLAGWQNAGPESPQISADGRFVAFASDALNLVPGDANLGTDVFVRDLGEGSTEIVSIASDGSRGTGLCELTREKAAAVPSISADGRFVAFESCYTNLIPGGGLLSNSGDSNRMKDIFVHDRKTGTTERVSVSSDETQSNASSFRPSISDNGRHVAFASSADNLVDGDSPSTFDLFVRDRKKGTTERVSVASDASEARYTLGTPSGCPSISGDGRFVAFASGADNMVEGDTNGSADIFVHDRVVHETTRVSIASDGSEASPTLGGSQMCGRGERILASRHLSSDGRFVAFRSFAPNLVPNDSNDNPGYGMDIFVHDRKTGRTERVSVTSAGETVDSESGDVSISTNGRYVVFASTAPFFPGDTGDSPFFVAPGDFDIFVYDRTTGALDWVSLNDKGDQAAHCFPGHSGSEFVPTETDPEASESFDGSVSSDGRYVAYTSCADNLVKNDTDGFRDIFVRDRGQVLGTGRSSALGPSEEPPAEEHLICITPDICIPPGGVTTSKDEPSDVTSALRGLGADLYGASLAYRPQYDDLFATVELAYMPPVFPGISPIFYGLRFEVDNTSYEIRANSFLGGDFGLFDCTITCSKVSGLSGGYGTTGMRLVLSLPLDKIGLDTGGRLSHVEAFSAVGSSLTGEARILDTVGLGRF